MKIIKKINILILALSLISLVSCDLDGGESLNGASTNSITDDLSRGELPQVMAGILSDMRVGLGTQVDVQSILGREYYFITASDPRFEADVVTGIMDDNTFYTTTAWSGRYAAIKDINLALEGLANTTADFSSAEIAATRGVLNTLMAHELLMVANNQFQNGIRIDVSDADNLGPFVSYDDALTAISGLLSDAGNDLATAAGVALPFSLTSVVPFLQFNKGLAARVEAYRGNYPSVLSLLADSFMDLGGDLGEGFYHTFSLAGADQANPLFGALNQSAIVRIAHSSYIDDAEAGDTRVNKVVLRDDPFSTSDTGNGVLAGTHDVWINQSNVDDVPIMRNEELILLYAEANMVTNPADAVMALNVIRNAAGLANYAGAQTPDALEVEMLKQRRYSLFGEGGHRWIDMRRFNRLDELPNDRPIDNIIQLIPVPQNENR